MLNLTRTRALLSLSLALFLLAGCSRPLFVLGDEASLDLNLADVLPEEWTALDRLTEISIDGDDATEYLLFFSYDNGQVGAAIFDTQVSTDAAQPVGFYKPYVLLPNYWSYVYGDDGDMGQGFVAAPADSDTITAYQIGAMPEDTPTENAAPDTPPELVILGGSTHLTFVWWRALDQGYGVTQLYAPGGFRGIDWREWRSTPTAINSIAGLYPYQDYRGRSLICREVLYTRIPADTSPAYAISFDRLDQGIAFCDDDPPAYPFYPEGVVLAYLRAANDASARAEFATPGISPAQVDADVDTARLVGERIEDIATYPTIAAAPGEQGAPPPATSVCVELAPYSGLGKRWLLFTLRYQPPDLTQRLPERWTISGAAPEPVPVVETPSPYCNAILERGLPAPRN